MAQATPTAETAPTVVLVHGAFADAGSWAGVVKALQAAGVKVQAAANPLRSVSGDAAYIASVANQIPGPVLLVGHSYGGAVDQRCRSPGRECGGAGLRRRVHSGRG